MTRKQQNSLQSLTTRLIQIRHELARHARLRRHPEEAHGDFRQPSKFSLLMLIGLTAVGVIAAISAIQILEAAVG
ncbi:MAG: hypothetical protein JWM58_695 [Rhizobium sp.]|nr:hypothetical protein [Rhizobium sp.]